MPLDLDRHPPFDFCGGSKPLYFTRIEDCSKLVISSIPDVQRSGEKNPKIMPSTIAVCLHEVFKCCDVTPKP